MSLVLFVRLRISKLSADLITIIITPVHWWYCDIKKASVINVSFKLKLCVECANSSQNTIRTTFLQSTRKSCASLSVEILDFWYWFSVSKIWYSERPVIVEKKDLHTKLPVGYEYRGRDDFVLQGILQYKIVGSADNRYSCDLISLLCLPSKQSIRCYCVYFILSWR